uniref:Uncharacterized protein n=1 Tax=Pelusios castaneus TaxID=367368 RepID=A0A8C8VPE9_9SAUR
MESTYCIYKLFTLTGDFFFFFFCLISLFQSAAFNPAHTGHMCSTWGNFHFKTFDGDIFHFPGLCNYVFASHCHAAYEDFNIQIQRTMVENAPTINHITMKLDGAVLEMEKNVVVVDGKRVQLPYSQSGILAEGRSMYVKVTAKMGLVFIWNEDGSILVGMNSRCFREDNICRKILTGPEFSECNTLVEVREYITSCEHDLCHCGQSKTAFCICNTFGEYSRQCVHAGGKPLNWRTPERCPKTCPFNMQYQECGSPCTDTCSNTERSLTCEDHCMDGCFCPPGTVFDDITRAGCIPFLECSCTYNGILYAPGKSYRDPYHSCTCSGGKWNCKETPRHGSCTIEGGSHISTFDEKRYNFHGDCTYVLSKLCENGTFAVLGELRPCGLTDTETCLKTITLSINGGQTVTNVTIFRPSTFFIIVETNFGHQLEIQLVPIMQVFVRLDPSYKGQTCGLCGNFNNLQTDDFKVMSGVVEGTGAAFANTWKTNADCLNFKNSFENPCALSVENEKYAQHWCGLLTNKTGRFANCHSTVVPDDYHKNCLFDTCNCEKSEDCLCAALSSYVRACAAKGIQLEGWRTDVCCNSCPKSLSYSYDIRSYQSTCRSLSEPDVTSNIRFIPVDGCTCEEGTYMDEYGKCVPAGKCPCYYKGSPISSGEAVHKDGLLCACTRGKLSCIGSVNQMPVCAPPMVYFDCRNITAGTTGAECQKSCQTLDMQCYSTQCMSGCMCPSGLVANGNGSCITEEECPCMHNEATYQPGEEIKVDCNTCVCKNRMWVCTHEQCLGTCAVYGDGHYITFDEKRFNFNGVCDYTLVQDHCGKNSIVDGSFRVVTENIPCGSTGTTCSKSIKIFLQEHLEVVKRTNGMQMPYQIRYMGMYLVIETNNGLILMWDKKTSIFIKLSPDFKGQVCGLCGNYDGKAINDFTTRSQSVVGDVVEFGNSWKMSLACPDANSTKDPCSINPYRKAWSQKQCSIIISEVFTTCHSQVDPTKYYEACVADACACNTGGDCECFCTAVAAYAQACSEFGVCVAWRTPSICPMFCDYYNSKGGCEWHYKPCGAPCMKTCRNPSGSCLHMLQGLEGCYPNCPGNKPYFNENEMKCVDTCGCYDAEGNYHEPGISFYSWDNCQIVLVPPAPVEKITCASGLPPVKVYDETGCNYHYECDCVCTGWSNSDYMTFDGIHYTFHDNCTYVLMKQIVPKHNFSILIDNYFCEVPDRLPCTRSIIVNYNSMEIVLISQKHQEERNKVKLNRFSKPINGGFSKDGLSVANAGKNMVVVISDIKSHIAFNGFTFRVKIPFNMFGHNTEGQCGTCSNDKVDECRMPNGKIISSCSEMASSWKVEDENKPHCEGAPTPVPPVMPTTPVPCNSTSLLCELILIFAECHNFVLPGMFYKSCISSSCHVASEAIPCKSLEMYASLCAFDGACVDWRSKTQGKCRNYLEKNSYDHKHQRTVNINILTFLQPGARWTSNCQECVCDPFSVTVQCKPLTCQTPETRMCEKEGFIPVPVLTPEDPCCPEIECSKYRMCNTIALCCPLGNSVSLMFWHLLCSQNCIKLSPYTISLQTVDFLKIFAQTEWSLFGLSQTGMSVPMDACKTCTCSSEVDPASNRNLLQCEPVHCDTACPLGYEYMMKDGECCGECIQVACTIKLNNNTNSVVIQHNECESSEPVELTFCEGVCVSSSVYSFETQQMQHKCTCCQELKSHKREVTLTCRNGTSMNYDYVYVEQCQFVFHCPLLFI